MTLTGRAFDGCHVAVTGAAGGLGTATASAFLAEGATVAAIDLSEPDPSSLLTDRTDGLNCFVADVSDEAAVRDLVASIGEVGPLSHLVNIAGIGSTTTAPDTPVEVWNRV